MVKETMKRKKPSFNETYYGFRTFSHLLEDAQRRGIVVLRRDQKSGSYIVEDLGPSGIGTQAAGPVAVPAASRPVEAPAAAAAGAEPAEPAANGARAPRRRRSRARRPRAGSLVAPGVEGAPAGEASGAEDGSDGDLVDADAQDIDEGETGPDAAAGDTAFTSAREDKPAGEPPPPRRDEDTGPFSFFSWMRRDADPKK
jgi:hypothetical protein